MSSGGAASASTVAGRMISDIQQYVHPFRYKPQTVDNEGQKKLNLNLNNMQQVEKRQFVHMQKCFAHLSKVGQMLHYNLECLYFRIKLSACLIYCTMFALVDLEHSSIYAFKHTLSVPINQNSI